MRDLTKITLIGTGLMGAPMARNLMSAGFDLTVWNRSPERAKALLDEGAKTAADLGHAIEGADVVLSMVSDGFVTQGFLEDAQVERALADGMLWVDMSSTKPAHARAQSATLAEYGVAHLDAPVSGGTKGAEDATLAIMVGGTRTDFERALPMFNALGRVVYVGPSGSGQLCKLANQTIVGITISAVAEATLMVEQGGADPAALRRALSGGFADSIILQQHGQRMSEGNFVPGGPARLQLKDLDNALEQAGELGLELPATQAVRDRYLTLCDEMNASEKDHAALYLELKARNALT